jgi:hypothetical protein
VPKTKRRKYVQLLEIAICNVIGTPIGHRIELNAVRELHLGGRFLFLFNNRVPSATSKGLRPEPESCEAGAVPAELIW